MKNKSTSIKISIEDYKLLKKLAKKSKRTIKAMVSLILEIYYRAK